MKKWNGRFSIGRIFCTWRVSVSKELWHSKLANGNKQFHIVGTHFEEDHDEPDLKAWVLIILWLSITVGFIRR